jgi:hypothetical protein
MALTKLEKELDNLVDFLIEQKKDYQNLNNMCKGKALIEVMRMQNEGETKAEKDVGRLINRMCLYYSGAIVPGVRGR